ncbi:unnamed protein product [Rangifer tarandus platyrhynchus]|uniref:Uncharacterized protein n=2 Tax=Rangifer tarandus platyrhynchus TaxID=3082113 RepID=A0ACB0DWW7_RANTA|nr:unnamed protein product [Rangifer tarandus platyrhynchus]CAI9692664.1 unnamed protein product [Rangifer tarandus platyrhynchus]
MHGTSLLSRTTHPGDRKRAHRAQAFWPSRPPSRTVSAARAGPSGTCSSESDTALGASLAPRPLAGSRRRG